MTSPVYIVDIIGDCVALANAKLAMLPTPIVCSYTYGRQVNILEYLQNLRNNPNGSGNAVYPLIALFMDFPEDRGVEYYCKVTIPRLQISCITQSTADIPTRYNSLTFKPILYPIYYALLQAFANCGNIVGNDPDSFIHRKFDRPYSQPVSAGLQDYIDAIELNNLTLTISQTKTC